MGFLDYMFHNSDLILRLTFEHLQLVGIAILAATVVGIPLGVAASRNATLKRWSLGFANVMQTVPSLALFGFLIPATGIGARTAVIALALYALLPILRNTCAGIAGVDRAVIEAAQRHGDDFTSDAASGRTAVCRGRNSRWRARRRGDVDRRRDNRGRGRRRRTRDVYLSGSDDGEQQRDSCGRHSGRRAGGVCRRWVRLIERRLLERWEIV